LPFQGVGFCAATIPGVLPRAEISRAFSPYCNALASVTINRVSPETVLLLSQSPRTRNNKWNKVSLQGYFNSTQWQHLGAPKKTNTGLQAQLNNNNNNNNETNL
jgi:hypothetical protein